MRFTILNKECWNLWFAWHPIKIEENFIWLEFVERRVHLAKIGVFCDLSGYSFDDYDYIYEYRELKK